MIARRSRFVLRAGSRSGAPPPWLRSLLLLSALLAGPAQAATFVVDTINDGADVTPGDGICRQSGPPPRCSLRAAIGEANALAGADTINFSILPAGANTIVLGSALPMITTVVTIDGTTQPGFVPLPPFAPVIELNGTAGGSVLDLRAGSSGSTIRGLCINRSTSNGIRILGSSNNVIVGNFLGTNLAGTAAGPGNFVGVYIGGSGGATNSNRVGGTAAADRNVISGNTNDGIQINGVPGAASSNLIQGNYIGLDVTGTLDVGNTNQGVAIFGTTNANNVIGGTAAGAGNVISGNNDRGVMISSAGTTGTLVQGNRIGTDAAGTAGVPNNTGGVRFDAGTSNNTVGGTVAGAANTIAYNGNSGVWFTTTAGTGNSILGNAIHSNVVLGIDLGNDGVTANDLGDTDTGPNNRQNFPVLSAAMTNGAGSAHFAGSLNGAASTTYRIEFFASTAADPSGFGEGQRYLSFTNVTTNAAGHALIGATLATSLTAGEFVTATATSPSNNTSEFGGSVQAVGFLVVTTTADTADGITTSVSNLIGNPGPDGRISLREAILAAEATAGADTIRFGIPLGDANHLYYQNDAVAGSLSNVQATTLADLSTPSSPVITGYDPDYPAGTARSWYRIALASALPTITDAVTLDAATQPLSIAGAGPVIELDGAAVPGTVNGLFVTAGGSTIRGLVINRFSDNGIRVDGASAVGNVIVGNYIGTDVTGTLDLGNVDDGVDVRGGATNTRIGGTTAADRNVISGNDGEGAQVTDAGTTGTLLQGNYIGIDATGTVALGNTSYGVVLGTSSSSTTVGGAAPGAGNVISGNTLSNVRIQNAATANVVLGNIIGLNAAGTAAVVNGLNGVSIANGATNNTLGGTVAGAGNRISGNANDGVRILDTSTGNSILGNAIYSNADRGIDLSNDAVTPNDPLDVDSGPNDLLNFPLLTACYESAGTLTTHFQLDVPAGSYRIEFFKNPSGADATGFGEGQVFAGTRNVTHPGGGAIFFNHTFAGVTGDLITATTTFCTDGATCAVFGSTSEYAKALSAFPTAVTLLSFTAGGRDGAVDLAWTTASELSNLGFHLYRAEAVGGSYTRITTSLIPGLGSSPTGRSYAYRDAGLVNGRTYYYLLEDVETTGRTERHGPVSATPIAASSGGTPPTTPGGPATGTSYGDAGTVELREVERSERHVVLELRTGGFVASPAEGGRVRLWVPGFESASGAGEPRLPARRAFVEAASGRKVRLTLVRASDEIRFPGLRPVAQGLPEIATSDDGMVLPIERAVRDGRAFRELFPSESALLLGTSFQAETKKAELLFFPVRWDGRGVRLSRLVRVRLEFGETEEKETSRGGSRGRRWAGGDAQARRGVAAQIVARERGLYRVDYEDVFGTMEERRRRDLPASSLRLSRQGEGVAFHVESVAGTFGPGSSLYFLSEGSSLNRWGDAVYELETSGGGLLMDVADGALPRGTVSEYLSERDREENQYYQAGLLEAPDLWLWDLVVSPGSRSYGFSVEGLREGSSSAGRLRVVMQGGSDFDGVTDHHVRVRVNGTYVGETSWDGKKPKTLELELEPGVLREGLNTLELECVGDTGAAYSMVFLNRFTVRYPRRLVAVDGTLEGSFSSTGMAEIEGLSGSSFVVETGEHPRWLRGASAIPGGLRVGVEAGKSYLVTSTALRPEVRRFEATGLRSPSNRADYLLVAPRAFLSAAEPLLDLRASQGLVTKPVALEDVYAEFGHGEVGPQGIKSFLEYAYHSWASPSVRYVVLLGDASYDPKDHLGTGVKDRLPGFPVKTSYLWTVSDPAYASVNGEDPLPDIAIGRLPAGSLDEALRMVEKILRYENGGGRLDGPAVLVADNADAAGNFEQDADEIASGVLQGRDVRKIYYSQYGANTRASIQQAFDEGASLMSYVGHGATAVWASENIFNYTNVASLAAQPQQPFLLTMNCLNGFFHFPPLDSLSEALLKAEGKGAVGAFSPSGLSVNEAAHRLHKAVLEQMVSGRHERIGDALLAAEERYAESGAFPELLSIYNLLGDPALPLR